VASRFAPRYFTGLLALVTLAGFILNLVVVGSVFNMVSTENSMLAWGTLALVLAYRYRLRLMLALGLLFLTSYVAAAFTARMGYQWLEFWDRPEQFLLLGLLVFSIPFLLKHPRQGDFAPVFRLVGALTFFIAVLSLAEWGVPSYITWDSKNIERAYELFGLIASAGAIWLGIARNWNGLVNTGSVFFTLFLVARLYHWWWDWMPKYLFFAAIGALGIGLVMLFKRLRSSMIPANSAVTA
jgi:hypothetical protein